VTSTGLVLWPDCRPAAGEAGGFNAVQKLFTTTPNCIPWHPLEPLQPPGAWCAWILGGQPV